MLLVAAASVFFAGVEHRPLGGELLSPPGTEEVSSSARMAVAVVAALIAAAIVLNVRGLEDRRRQLLEESLEGCSALGGGMGEGVRFLEPGLGVNERSLAVIPSPLNGGPTDGCMAPLGTGAMGGGSIEDSTAAGGCNSGRDSDPLAEGKASVLEVDMAGALIDEVFFSRFAASRRCCSSCSTSERRMASMIIICK